MTYDWDFSALIHYAPAFGRGVIATLALTAIVIATGTPAGIAYALLLRKSPNWLRRILVFLMDILRCVPVLVLLFLSYYAIPIVLHGSKISAFGIASIGLAAYLGAFVADVTRGALDTVPTGYIDAARAVGLSSMAVFWRIESRYVLKVTMPTIAVLWIGTLKNSSIASIIGVYELTHIADMTIANTFRSIETYTVVALLYIAIIFPLSVAARHLEGTLGGFKKQPQE